MLSRTQFHPTDVAVGYIHAGDTSRFKADPEGASRFEQVHAQLLGAQPSCPSGVQGSHG